jgi:hypothetical protein
MERNAGAGAVSAGRPIAEASAVIHAPIDKVLDLVMTVRPGPTGGGNFWLMAGNGQDHAFQALHPAGLTVSGGPRRFDVHAGAQHLVYLDVDRPRRTVGVEGHWWYRGEYTFDPDQAATRLTHRVLNVAKRGRWAVPLANRLFIGYHESVRQAANDVARRIEEAILRS